MIFLKTSGLDAQYDETTKELILNGKRIQPDIRKLKDITDVIMDKKWLGQADMERNLYYMFRDIKNPEDEKTIKENNVRYDITVIPPGMLGKEYIKTAGHDHPLVPETSKTYTELYEVIKGKGTYLLQKTKGSEVIDAYFIQAKAGDKIIIPPGYGHITINESDEPLIMSNWVAGCFRSIYDTVKDLKGAALYITKHGIEKNPRYIYRTKKAAFKQPDNPELLGLKKHDPIYNMIKKPFHFGFLTEPQNHERMFKYLEEKKTEYKEIINKENQ